MGNVVYAPVNGRVDVVTVTNHAIGILADNGAKILVHVGLGTVNMDGKGFTRYVEAGDIVAAGQPILSFDDAKILVHVGLGTVNMDGKGFTRYVEAGDIVAAGQPILSFDDEAIKAAGCDDVVTCVVSNPTELESVDLIGSSNTLLGGRPLVKVGDPLVVCK